MVRIIARTFRLKAKSKSSSVTSMTVPAWTKPAQFEQYVQAPAAGTCSAIWSASSAVQHLGLTVQPFQQIQP